MSEADSRVRWREIAAYIGVPLLTLVIAFTAMDLWRADLRVPFEPHGDGLLHAMMVKVIEETGWIWGTSSLGAPGSLEMLAFPAFDTLGVLIIRMIALFTDDHFLILNLTFLLSFPMIALAGLWSARRLGLSLPASALVAILFALLPYHFRRGVGHLFLSLYMVVPLISMVTIRLAMGWGDRSTPDQSPGRAAVFLIALLTGLSGVYYPFFACGFLLLAIVIRYGKTRTISSVVPATLVLCVVMVIVVLALSPAILHSRTHDSLDVIWRKPSDAERFGLKIAQLVLPITDHRIHDFEEVKIEYNRGPLNNENDLSSLGLVGTVGFLFLLWTALRSSWSRPGDPLISVLSAMNLWAILIGTIGGVGALFAVFVSPNIRAYNRISVFIAFFSLVAIGTMIDRLRQSNRPWARTLVIPLVVLIVISGSLDQTNSKFTRFHGNEEARSFARFGERIEEILPSGSRVLQLPYFPFPENGPVHGINDYEHFRPYLFTSGLSWSYGAIKGDYPDIWQRNLVSQPTERMIQGAALAGFDAIYIDRQGFPEGAENLLSSLDTVVLEKPLTSQNGRFSVYPLSRYASTLRARLTAPELDQIRLELVEPVLVKWGVNCYGLESNDQRNWRWCKPKADFYIVNGSDATVPVTVRFLLAGARRGTSIVRIQSEFGSPILEIDENGSSHRFDFDVPPGQHRVKVRSSGDSIQPEGDSRTLGIRFIDFELTTFPPRPGVGEVQRDEWKATTLPSLICRLTL